MDLLSQRSSRLCVGWYVEYRSIPPFPTKHRVEITAAGATKKKKQASYSMRLRGLPLHCFIYSAGQALSQAECDWMLSASSILLKTNGVVGVSRPWVRTVYRTVSTAGKGLRFGVKNQADPTTCRKPFAFLCTILTQANLYNTLAAGSFLS